MTWDPSREFLAQAGHALLGALCVLAPAAWFPGYWTAPVVGTVFFLAYSWLKELWWDPEYETNEPVYPNGVRDLAFLLGGAGFGWVSLGVAWLMRRG